MIEPQYQPLIGFPLAWTPGTNGVVHGDAIYAPLATDADLDKFQRQAERQSGADHGAQAVDHGPGAVGRRLTDAELEARDARAGSIAAGESVPPSNGSRPADS